MDNKISTCMFLILYTTLAGVPTVLGYFQYDQEQTYSGESCGSCHVDPNASANISFSNKTDQISYQNASRTGTENKTIIKDTQKQ